MNDIWSNRESLKGLAVKLATLLIWESLEMMGDFNSASASGMDETTSTLVSALGLLELYL